MAYAVPPYCPMPSTGTTTATSVGSRSSTEGKSPEATRAASIGDSWKLEIMFPDILSYSSRLCCSANPVGAAKAAMPPSRPKHAQTVSILFIALSNSDFSRPDWGQSTLPRS